MKIATELGLYCAIAGLFVGASVSPAVAQQPTPQERIAALKASMAASKEILRQYEWMQTTIVSVDGEEKSREMDRCYYGADGKLQKVPVTTPPPQKELRGIRGRIAERKQEEMKEYTAQVVALIKEYVPPDEKRMEGARAAGKVSVQPLPEQKARLTFSDYFKVSDSLALDIDLANNRPVAAKVATYLEAQDQPITLQVKFGSLPNSATYASSITLDAKEKDLRVVVENSGYRKP